MIRLFLSLSLSPTFSLLLALGRFCSLHGIKGPLVAPVLSLVVVRATLIGVAREKERAVRVVLAPSFLLSFLCLPFHSFPLFLRTLAILLIQGSVGRVGPVAALSIPAIGASIELSLNVASSFSPTADETRRGGPLRAGFVACGRSSPFYSPGNRRLIIFRYVQFRRRSLSQATATGGSSVSRDSREPNRHADIHRSSALGPRGYGT